MSEWVTYFVGLALAAVLEWFVVLPLMDKAFERWVDQ